MSLKKHQHSKKEVHIDSITFEIELFLGGDWKFLAMVCGLYSATSTVVYGACKCPRKDCRIYTSKTWSLVESQKGVRTIEEITSKPKLGKSNRHKYNCSSKPLFPFIPI